MLVARREERLHALRDELARRDPNLNVHIRKTDLSKGREIEELLAWIEAEDIDVDLLINNAGLGDFGPFATIEPQRLEQILNVNIVALTVITRRLLPGMLARKRGGVLNVSSSAEFPADRRFRRLRREQSVRHEFFRSAARGSARQRSVTSPRFVPVRCTPSSWRWRNDRASGHTWLRLAVGPRFRRDGGA